VPDACLVPGKPHSLAQVDEALAAILTFIRLVHLVRPGESGGCYVCEPSLILPEASAL